MSRIPPITGDFFLNWHGNREATTREVLYYLNRWPCVCARCLICKVILDLELGYGEEE